MAEHPTEDDPIAELRAWWAMEDDAKVGSTPPAIFATLGTKAPAKRWNPDAHRFETSTIEPGTRVRVNAISPSGALGIAGNLLRRWGYDALVEAEALSDFGPEP